MRYRDRNLDRRDFVRAIGAAALGAGPVFAGGRPLDPLSPGIKISLQIPGDFTAEDLVFAKQLGVEFVSIPTRGGTYETFARYKQRVEAAGLNCTALRWSLGRSVMSASSRGLRPRTLPAAASLARHPRRSVPPLMVADLR